MVDLTIKPYSLNERQLRWVEETLASMSDDEKIKQLFVNLTGAGNNEEQVKHECETMQMGAIRFNPRRKEEMWEMNRLFQKYSKIPVLSAANVEAGGNGATSDGTNVGQEIKVAATGDKSYAYKMGQICGRETRAVGSNWAFAPIVDLTYNWHNPVISTRAFGKDADMVLEFSREYFRGISESGILCAMKHFPGDGQDERDQHVATSVNTMSCEEWDATYGKVYAGLIEDGIQSVMPGHIMMPAYQKRFDPGLSEDGYLPATICRELLTDLLREKLGFNGLIVSDASHMVGLTGRAKRSELVPQAIMAGCDMFLFYNDFAEDIGYMAAALKDGRLSRERLDDAVRRILGLKALAGLAYFSLDDYPSRDGLDIVGCAEHRQVSDEVSEKSVTLVKQVGENIFPITDKKRVLLVPVGPKPSPILAVAGMGADGSALINNLKSELEAHGHSVEIYVDPVEKIVAELAKLSPEERENGGFEKLKKKGAYGMKTSIASLTDNYDLVICVANVSATMRTTQRLEWAISKGGWDNPWYVNEIPTIFVSFNCPFHLADVPQVKNFVNCYDSQPSSVRAFVRKLEGESEFTGVSTVDAFCGLMDTRF